MCPRGELGLAKTRQHPAFDVVHLGMCCSEEISTRRSECSIVFMDRCGTNVARTSPAAEKSLRT